MAVRIDHNQRAHTTGNGLTYDALYDGVEEGTIVGAFVYVVISRRGGNSPKISPSCGRAWHVSAGVPGAPTE
jgi:hypothetical protein